MAAYILRRLLWMPVVLLAVSFITFTVGQYGPGDPVQVLMGQKNNPEVVERIRKERGLDLPIHEQYFNYVSGVLHGDFGESYKYVGQKVSDLIFSRVWVSVQLGAMALAIGVTIGMLFGLAAALNKGIQWAGEQASSHVLFLDQDSIPKPDMVGRLVAAIANLASNGAQVAGVGPVVVDPRLGTRSPFVTFGPLRVIRRSCNGERPDKHLSADFLITSGMLASMQVFAEIGAFDEGLFIDNVDLEWCFRARAKGFRCYGVCDAELEHYLGDSVGRIWLGRWMPIYYHAPIRQYYIMRNRILLYKKRYSPKSWILQDIARAIFKFVVYSVFVKNRLQNIRMMLLGVSDGMRGRVGEISHDNNQL